MLAVRDGSLLGHALPRSAGSGTLKPMELPQSARELIESGSLAHLVTLNSDGSPQVTCVWVGLDDDEIVSDISAPVNESCETSLEIRASRSRSRAPRSSRPG